MDYVNSMFSVREVPWHKKGDILADYPGREEAMHRAGHDFEVIEKKLATIEGTPVEGWKALMRKDTAAILSVVKQSYGVVQNEVMWDMVDALVAEPNVKYETAGVLKDGAVLWVLARLEEAVTIPGDNSPILPYVLVATSHDYSCQLIAATVPTRVVCWNTYRIAMDKASALGTEYSFRHSKNVMDRVEEARAALGLVRSAFVEFIELATELAGMSVSEEGIKFFLSKFIPEPPALICTDRVMANINEARTEVAGLLHGSTISEANAHTAYGLVNAGVEYLDHLRGYRNEDTHFNRCVMNIEKQKTALVKLARASVEMN